ncbi:uncharacterized protein B0I36DRAFT_356960 [Microdochium trichocladiopsis]|uniref:Uncharacterized protein n=1 Tax=Microdochium trichocladiopsis TaxID=1682393 RepID=A0A9P8YFX9_9PEZI|nr:uncharacterized protein B0I36DRAFT_356960 [Microdochium trichocladiopsis]KAH7039545.1 hypothetical protein B0I36DRAFT_356960 [Microdochium trichocladiopsis]
MVWEVHQYRDYPLDPANKVSSKTSRYYELPDMTLQTLQLGKGGDNPPDAWAGLHEGKQSVVPSKKKLDQARADVQKDFANDNNPDKPKTFAQRSQQNAPEFIVAYQN